ncbi:hypothetical protein SCHPADRAFT_497737 [Schizopora paradoxa]|uniref:Uncharacterized protein n=1 Tax=Schizopora paradoxa TaxID=27342 RepID=A0A0H2RGH1_9AGAM|nr:hypothetical protein SCHPADRAFT_497737 [Schizopora paradoxa]
MTAEVIGAPKELDGTPSLRLAPRPPFLRFHPSIHLGNRQPEATWRCRVISDSRSELTNSRTRTHCCQQEHARQDANSAQTKASRCCLRHSLLNWQKAVQTSTEGNPREGDGYLRCIQFAVIGAAYLGVGQLYRNVRSMSSVGDATH